MGYVMAVSACISCERVFSYNPHKVPSLRVNGVREPVCLDCITRANPLRVKNGLPEIVPSPDAYEAMPEEEL